MLACCVLCFLVWFWFTLDDGMLNPGCIVLLFEQCFVYGFYNVSGQGSQNEFSERISGKYSEKLRGSFYTNFRLIFLLLLTLIFLLFFYQKIQSNRGVISITDIPQIFSLDFPYRFVLLKIRVYGLVLWSWVDRRFFRWKHKFTDSKLLTVFFFI